MKRYRPLTMSGSDSMCNWADSCLTRLFFPSIVVQYITRCSLATPKSMSFCNTSLAFRWSGASLADTYVIKKMRYLLTIRVKSSITLLLTSNVSPFWLNRMELVVMETRLSFVSSTTTSYYTLVSDYVVGVVNYSYYYSIVSPTISSDFYLFLN